MEILKTYLLMTTLTVIFIWFGGMIAGEGGMIIAFIVAGAMNFYAYYFSSTQVLKHYKAIEVDHNSATGLYKIVERLCYKANLPMPKIYIIPQEQPNAFATGRNYENSVVAVTEGLLKLMTQEEIEAVIAHELSHIKHYDMLIGTVTASIAGAIAMLSKFGMMFRGSGNNRPNPIVMIALIVVMPLVATIIRMSVSRNREFMADAGSAEITGHPEWLQSALSKLDSYARGTTMENAEPQTAHMFIINPFTGKDFSLKSLFSTHPKTQDRIDRLEELK